MASPIEFWFDFSSGYGYFAALEIDDLAAVLCKWPAGREASDNRHPVNRQRGNVWS